MISENGDGPPVFVDDLLSTLSVPLLLLWGIKDPWIRPQAAERIQVRVFVHSFKCQVRYQANMISQALFPAAIRVNVDAGHCPHDGKFTLSLHFESYLLYLLCMYVCVFVESPDAVNAAIASFMSLIHKSN